MRSALKARGWKASPVWLVVMSVAIIAVVAAFILLRRERDALDRLIDATAAMDERPIEARLSRFPYAPCRTRATAIRVLSSGRLRLRGLAAQIAAPQTGADSHASAVAYLVIGNSRTAVDLMERAVRDYPANATGWSDLAAARYELASKGDDVIGFISAAAAADAALRLDPSSEEASFNRALAWDAAHEVRTAERAYQRFLMLSSSLGWSQEARERLAKLEASKKQTSWNASLPAIEAAAQAKNSERIAQFVAQFPEESRWWSEAEFLGRWANAETAGDQAEGKKYLTIARQLAAALRDLNGECLVADSIATIDRAGAKERAELLEGHRNYHEGRRLYSLRRLGEAAPLLDRAALHFRNGGSPMAAVAAYYAANLAVDTGRFADAAALAATAHNGTSPRYRALNAELDWLRGTMEGLNGHLFESLQAYSLAAAAFAALGESNSEAYMRTSEATILTRLGQDQAAWRAKRDAWAYLGRAGDARSLQIALIAAADGEILQSRFDTARTLLSAALELSPDAQNPRAESRALVWRAICSIRIAPSDASRELDIARQRASGLRDPDLRLDALNRVRVAEATATTDAALAVGLLTESIDFAQRHGQHLNMPTLLLQRGRRRMVLGDLGGAVEDFRQAAAAVEERRAAVTADDLRDSYFGTVRDVYSALADALQRSGLTGEAFETAEKVRARVILDRRLANKKLTLSCLPVAELQRQLSKRTTVLEFVAADDHVLRFQLSHSALVCDVLQLSPTRIAALVDQLRQAIQNNNVPTARRDGEVLYQKILGSVARNLTPDDRLIIVADEALERLPFGALFDRAAQQYLVEQVPFDIASSTNLFVRSRNLQGRGIDTATIVADPTIDMTAFPRLERLGDAALEAERLRAMYPTARVLTGDGASHRAVLAEMNASIIHFATHAVLDDREPAQSCLVLAPDGQSSGALYLHEIAQMHLASTRLVILAGCRTGITAAGGHGDVRSLATAFLMAGVTSVAASLWDMDDQAQQEFSILVHQNLRQGISPAVALRNAQLTMLHSNNPRLNTLRAWSGMEVFGSD